MFVASSYVFALLLVATGLAKMRRPEFTYQALLKVGVSLGQTGVRLFGLFEVVVGFGVLAGSGIVPIVSQTLLYGLFLAWVAFALVLGVPLETCGCLGREDTPPYWGHVLVNAIGFASSFGASLTFNPSTSLSGLGAATTWFVAAVGALLAWWIIGEASQVTLRLSSR